MSKIKVLAFSGRKQMGKDSAGKYIANKLWGVNHGHVSFAEPLKKLAIDYFNLTHSQCYGTEEDKNSITKIKHPETGNLLSARRLLQFLGTDIFRKMYRNIWVDKALKSIDYYLYDKSDDAWNNDGVIVTDARFVNELNALAYREDTMIVKVDRPGYGQSDTHESETALDGLTDDDYDWVLRADNLDDLYAECDKFILALKNNNV